ncbi:MAG: hypothetical protein GC179_07410 [Anaerolineaceae bacterium]|nr:hypothetical protein [Anaerolineaceae bacterium]
MRLKIKPSSAGLMVCVGLLLLIWLTRLIGIDHFPPFIDEMIHVHGSELGYTVSPLVNADLGRQGTIWWMMLFQAHLGSPVWIARVATVLALLPGMAALMATARLFAGYWAAVLAGLLFLFSNYHLFFGRLALADPIAGSAVLVAIYFAARLSKRRSHFDALMVGILLTAGVVAKINVAPFLGVPIAAVLCLRQKKNARFNHRDTENTEEFRDKIRGRVIWLAVALGTAGILIGVFVLGLRFFGYDFVTNSVSYALTNRGNAPISGMVDSARIIGNIQASFDLLGGYLGVMTVILLLIAQAVLIFRRQFYVVLCLFGPMVAIWASLIQESRFLVVPVALLLLGGAVVLAGLVRDRNRVVQAAAVAVIGLWAAAQWLPFAITEVRQPNETPLPAVDVAQYINSDAAGTGYPEVRDFLAAYDVREVIGLVSNCQAFRYLTMSSYSVDCPALNPNGSSIPGLVELMNQKQGRDVFVLLQKIPYVPEAVPGKLLTVIERPGGGPSISIYQLSAG